MAEPVRYPDRPEHALAEAAIFGYRDMIMNRRLKPLILTAFATFSTASMADVNPESKLPSLHQAVIAGDLAQVRTLVENGADVNQLDRKMGNAPVHIAAQSDHPEILKYLLDQGAFINLQTPRSGFTPLMKASWYSKAENLDVLFGYPELNIELTTRVGAKAEDMVGGWDRNIEPHEARLYEQLKQRFVAKRDEQQALLEGQHILNTLDDTMLSSAEKASRIKVLLEQGADVNQRRPVFSNRNDWHTPLLVASREGDTEVVKVLLEYGADQTITGYPMNAIAMHKAAYMGHPEILKLLVNDRLADRVLNDQGPNNGYTPLHDAIWHGNAESARVLLEAGADTSLKTYEQDTPEALATRYRYENIEASFKE
ncbi:ankyrin repeat domain-containing protein [Oceanimonas sp. NS1]|nr:ankyrin repeat domain-containing protein [Oceanimonas sp. NS1]